MNFTISLTFLSPTLVNAAINGRLSRGIGIAEQDRARNRFQDDRGKVPKTASKRLYVSRASPISRAKARGFEAFVAALETLGRGLRGGGRSPCRTSLYCLIPC